MIEGPRSRLRISINNTPSPLTQQRMYEAISHINNVAQLSGDHHIPRKDIMKEFI